MTMTAVSRCAVCEAVINIHWPACLVCQAILPTASEVLPPSESTPANRRNPEDLHLKTSRPDRDAARLQQNKLDPVLPSFQAGDWVEWLSPALREQQAEVRAVHPDNTFEVFHPLSLTLCRLPVRWVTKVWKGPPGAIHEKIMAGKTHTEV